MWIKYNKQIPELGKDLWYYFSIVGVHFGQYHGDCVFGGANGVLGDDVTHWQYGTREEKPEPPY